ncbi:MAG: DEAD/DEAH box helicase family protein [Thermodesulfovibrionales bacterium]|nr:DEAD/DEAH box helicase family protein [Thermodesulfovibrionales bacterium]
MLELKGYQQRALDNLSIYFNRCVMLNNADTAFYEVTRDIYGQGIPYNTIKELPGLPYVCIRIPTGGGKTLVACHTVNITARDLLQIDHPLVLWLVPSNAILEQTINALKNPQHHYRQALEGTIGRVNVCDIHEALSLKRATLSAETTIIVSTIQAFRVDNTDGRKVYEDSGTLIDHQDDLIARGFVQDGAVMRSLANVINIWRPIVIVDEAHNARTDLSFSVLSRFNPSCIIEFTATPELETEYRSNVLHSVSAAELKADAMIKIPIALETRSDWKELLSDAIAMRNHLEAQSHIERQISGEYIRPIMLIQAQPTYKDKDSLTVEVVENCLLEDHKISREQIAIATGKVNELDKEKDVLLPGSKIRYIITIQALKEGWDCPFAYVLCSVAELKSSTAVEQILGRIMRLPKAAWKAKADLNMAYAYAASQNFFEAANALTDSLIKNGFNKQEAKDFITSLPKDEASPLFSSISDPQAVVTVKSPEQPSLECIPTELKDKLSIEADGNISFKGTMDDSERHEFKKCFSTPEGKAVVEVIYRKSRGLKTEQGSPSERGFQLSIPLLSIRQANLFETFEDRSGRVCLDSLKRFLSGKLLCLMPLPASEVV